jgi:hypothetical protein
MWPPGTDPRPFLAAVMAHMVAPEGRCANVRELTR